MTKSKNLWGSRFSGEPDPGFAEFNRSFKFDWRLFEADIRASVAHCNGLARAGVLAAGEAAKIKKALQSILERHISEPAFLKSDEAEDVHSFVEARLVELIGDVGRKLHTGRSRNDQVATDLRLWLRDGVDELILNLKQTQRAVVGLADKYREAVIPGYTHLQRAQPVLFAHWCLAYFEMLERDRERFADSRDRVNIMPLGSAALAGTSHRIDRESVARELEFDAVSQNSLDAVSDRDFCVEFLSCCSLVMVHLSRLAEDVILYTTTEFGFFQLSDAVATGSSLMPQKKNPDSMELIRGKSGRVFGHLSGLLAMLKGLPLAYNKDMQEDKEAVFDTFDTVLQCLAVTSTVLTNIHVDEERAREAAAKAYMNATELADYLVKKGMPFRDAHESVGRAVLAAMETGVELGELPLEELQKHSSLISADVFEALGLERTLATKSQLGGTAPERVAEQLARARSLVA